jgi:GTP-binding protein
VGKSSLMNSLMERKNLVRTSSTPGCTRQISFFEARSSDGVTTTLVDLPGYGYAKRSKAERKAWADLIEGYLLGRPSLSLVVVLVDVRRGVEDDDRELLELLAAPANNRRPVATLLIATKLDKLPVSQRKLALEKLRRASGLPVIGFSAKDGTGRDALWGKIQSTLGVG